MEKLHLCHIKKGKESPKLHRLWIIHIYEAFKAVVTKKTHSSLGTSSAAGDEQFGSCPCKSLIDIVLRKALIYVVTNQEKTELIAFNNDASSEFLIQ